MMVRNIGDVLGARILAGEEFPDQEVKSTRGSSMMSDILTFSKDHSVLLTGLCNPWIIRTAEILGIACIIFIKGRKPDESILEMTRDRGLVVMKTGRYMLSVCGVLYQAGLHDGVI